MSSGTDNLGALAALDLTAELIALLEELPGVMFCVKDAAGHYLAVNRTFVRRAGQTSRRAVVGRTAAELFTPDLADRYDAQDAQVVATGRALRHELEIIRRPGGRPGWFVTTKLPVRRPVEGVTRTTAVVSISTDLRSADVSDHGLQAVSRVVEQVDRTLGADPAHVPTTAELARDAGLSPGTLDRRMRRVFGLSTAQFVLKARIDLAMRLLAETDLPIAVVATRCGFYDQPSFTRRLARLTGETPAQFRRRSRAA